MTEIMLNTPFSPWPSFSEEEAEKVKQVLLSNRVNYWTGDEVKSFEKGFARWVGCKYAVALANGTVALECALNALGIGEGDEVITTPRTFFATASCIVRCGAKPVFADIDLKNQNISAETIEAVLTAKTKAVIVVHLAGTPAEMDDIMNLARKNNFFVVEDCAQAHGAKYKGRSVGTIGHIGAWSFCQDKIMTTGGEGGMVTTESEELWRRMWALKDHGKNYDAVYHRKHPRGFRWLHEEFGTNWRMTEMQGAIGNLQLEKVDAWVAKRRENSQKISDKIGNYDGVDMISPPSHVESSCYKYYFFIDPEALKTEWTRDRVIEEITGCGVPCYEGSCPEVYLEKAFLTQGNDVTYLPNARLLGERSVMLLVHPTLTEQEINRTCEVVSLVLEKALL